MPSYSRAAVAGLLALAVGCADEALVPPAAPSIAVDPAAVVIARGATQAFRATVVPAVGPPQGFAWAVRPAAALVIDSVSARGDVAYVRRVAAGAGVLTVSAPALGLTQDAQISELAGG